MIKDIKEIRNIKGFNKLPQNLKEHYIEFIHDILAEFSIFETIKLNYVKQNKNGLEISISIPRDLDEHIETYTFKSIYKRKEK